MKSATKTSVNQRPSADKKEGGYADRVHLLYAKTLDLVSHVIIAAMSVGYVIYLSGLLPLAIPVKTLAANWNVSAAQMQSRLHQPSGWSFLANPGGLLQGDIISYMSVMLLALATMFCLAVAVAAYFRERKPLFFTIALGQFLVLLVAASGIMAAGH